jgi:hypothetical protein
LYYLFLLNSEPKTFQAVDSLPKLFQLHVQVSALPIANRFLNLLGRGGPYNDIISIVPWLLRASAAAPVSVPSLGKTIIFFQFKCILFIH